MMKKMFIRVLWVLALSIGYWTLNIEDCSASIPGKINYQGKLTNADGELIDGPNNMSFTLFTQLTEGGSVWTESHSNVQVANGLFNVLMGSTSDMTTVFQENDALYLEVRIGTETLSPRHEMASVGYAIRSSQDNPVGTIQMFGGDLAPQGWLLCDGAEVSRIDYAGLFAVLGTTYGSGNGSTTFNLPDLQDRFAMGKSGTRTIGSTGGAATVDLAHTHTGPAHTHTTGNCTLTIAQMPSHTHIQNQHRHSITGSGGTQYSNGPYTRMDGNPGYTSNSNYTTPTNQNTGGGQAHNHGSTGSSGTGATGSALNASQTILNPYQVVSYIIKY